MSIRTFAFLAVLAAFFLCLVVFFPPRYETIERMRMTNQAVQRLVDRYKATHGR